MEIGTDAAGQGNVGCGVVFDLCKETGHVEAVIEGGQSARAQSVGLEGGPRDPRRAAALARQCRFEEAAGVAVDLRSRAEAAKVVLPHHRSTKGEAQIAAERLGANQSCVPALAVLRLHEGQSIGHDATWLGTAHAILTHEAGRHVKLRSAFALPREARAGGDPLEGRHVAPAVTVYVLPGLTVKTAREREASAAAGRSSEIGCEVLPVAGGRIGENIGLEPVAGALGNEVDDPAERRTAVKCRGRTLDHLDLRKVARQHLQQAEAAHLPAIERQAIGEQLGVAALKPLHPDVRRAERRAGDLHPHPTDLAHQHRDRTGAHESLFLDLLACDHLDPERFVLKAAAKSGALDDDGLALIVGLGLGRMIASLLRNAGVILRRSGKGNDSHGNGANEAG